MANSIESKDAVQKMLKSLSIELEKFKVHLTFSEVKPCFRVLIEKEQPVSTNVIVIPIKESITYSKLTRSVKKSVEAWIVNDEYECISIRFSGDDFTRQGLRRKLMMYKGYGLMTDKDYSRLFDLFMASAKIGLDSGVEYIEDGLSYDHKYLIYKGSFVSLARSPADFDAETAISLRRTFESYIRCAPPEKTILLLMIQLMGLSMETIKALPPEKRRDCLPTVLPYVFGDSGCGKTTISKAFFDAHDERRFIALSTSTSAAVQYKLSTVFGGVTVIDDVQHSKVGRCSSKATDKLENIIRTFGDIGAEKSTAYGKLPETGAWAVVTAESIFTTVHSSILRLLPIKFERGEIDFEKVQYLEDHKLESEMFFLSYLEWFSSQVTVEDGNIVDIKTLTEGYPSARNKLVESYSDIPYDRTRDNHCQLLNFFSFISRFFKMIGVEESYLINLKEKMLYFLHKMALLQCAQIFESSLSYYIDQAIDSILTEDNVAWFTLTGTQCSKITTCNDFETFSAITDGKSLIFTVPQQREFFKRIKSSLPSGSDVKNKDIKQELVSRKMLLNSSTDETLTYLPKENRIEINKKGYRVLKISIKHMEVDKYD